MMPSARRQPRSFISARVSCRNGCQFRMPTQTGSARPSAASAARRPSAWARVSVVERRAPAHQVVVMRDLLEPLGRDAAARGDELQERAHVLRALRPAEGDEQDRIDALLPLPSRERVGVRVGPSTPPPHPALSPPGRGIPALIARQLVDDVHEGLHVLDRRVLVDAVPEVEHVARAARPRRRGSRGPRGGSRARRPAAPRGRGCPAPPRRGRAGPTWARAPRASRARSRPRPPPS